MMIFTRVVVIVEGRGGPAERQRVTPTQLSKAMTIFTRVVVMVKRRGGPTKRRRVTGTPAQLGHVERLVLVVEVPVRLVRHCAEQGRVRTIFYNQTTYCIQMLLANPNDIV